ncbi:PTS system mannose/fructose/N-acetylgalactosamine-transporter subunit IIB [Geosporobacter ferrireducens]|uniref:PTS fructose transporter subunit IIB n=1 Tax=Geosporobacter ferrireducens TaxID=1424294 RepID=A0A1D8GKM4_9FIRM|nr:PTS sugar transporter subunit IIB [Geosporobacter ferrireducens]AOT71449.1 PTS fructose transporter subunit IIB [Geosporobacter ferrireducens]MTI57755.1 PTS sugar transporter subunit IIB [Geosporobacter ferrireducens]
MAISFIRIDDRIIHGQVVTRWAMENPCDGIIAVDDKAAKEPVLKSALKAASTRKTFIYSYDEFLTKIDQASNSEKRYFLITKNPATMAKILVDNNMKVETKVVNVGPQSAREGTININKNADITLEEAEAFEKIFQHGYEIDFRLVPDSKSVLWSETRKKFNK